MKTLLSILLISASLFLVSGRAEEKTMCGDYGHNEESFTGPEKSWLYVRGRGEVILDFGGGRTPMMDEGRSYCCFGEYSDSRKTLEVKGLGCEEE